MARDLRSDTMCAPVGRDEQEDINLKQLLADTMMLRDLVDPAVQRAS
jgi:hypothetical protein